MKIVAFPPIPLDTRGILAILPTLFGPISRIFDPSFGGAAEV